MSIPTISLTDFRECRFDYLIIGGGTAGLVVAARLSEDLFINVGVLEAGSASFDSSSVNVPGRYGETLETPLDWQYRATPQAGLGGRSLAWLRGKVLGRTSALNFMTWNRPNREDLDAWERLGNKGWGRGDLL